MKKNKRAIARFVFCFVTIFALFGKLFGIKAYADGKNAMAFSVENQIKLKNYVIPTVLHEGDSFELKGVIVSEKGWLDYIGITVYKYEIETALYAYEKIVQEKKLNECDLSDISKNINFDALPVGTYGIEIYADSVAGGEACYGVVLNVVDKENPESVSFVTEGLVPDETIKPTLTPSGSISPTLNLTVTPTIKVSPTITPASTAKVTPVITVTPTIKVTPTTTAAPIITVTQKITVTPTAKIIATLTPVPKTTEIPKITESPKTTEIPKITESPKTTDAPAKDDIAGGTSGNSDSSGSASANISTDISSDSPAGTNADSGSTVGANTETDSSAGTNADNGSSPGANTETDSSACIMHIFIIAVLAMFTIYVSTRKFALKKNAPDIKFYAVSAGMSGILLLFMSLGKCTICIISSIITGIVIACEMLYVAFGKKDGKE